MNGHSRNLVEEIARVREIATCGQGQDDNSVAVLRLCDIVEALLAPERQAPQKQPVALEVIDKIGQTERSPSGHWFRVTRIKLGEAVRVRIELMRVDRVVRALDSTDQGFRELGAILSNL